jgi:hypothetical protein
MAAPEPPFQWSEATIDPTPSGYVLTVPMNLDERATKLLEAALPQLPFGDLEYELYPQACRDASSIEPGKLRISTSEFFDVAPEEFEMLLHNAANKARKTSAEAQMEDDQKIRVFLEGLRRN